MPTTPAAIVEAEDVENAEAGVGADRDHRTDSGKRAAHDDRQADTEDPQAERLDQRGDAAGEQVGADQERDLVLGQFQRAPMISGTATAPAYMTRTC